MNEKVLNWGLVVVWALAMVVLVIVGTKRDI